MSAPSIAAQIAGLKKLGLAELQAEYERIVGKPASERNRRRLFYRLAYELQMRHFAALPPEVQDQINQYRDELRASPPESWFPGSKANRARQTRTQRCRDKRLPAAGTVLEREFRGHTVAVTILDKGFEFEGAVYRSLSAVAREIAGCPWNGYTFWGLNQGGTR